MKIEKLRPIASALSAHGALLLKLVEIEWAVEKARLTRMFALMLLASVTLFALVLFVSAFIIALAWNTPYRWVVALCLVVLYAGGLGLMVRQFRHLSHSSDQAFAGTREELAADFSLLKRKLLS